MATIVKNKNAMPRLRFAGFDSNWEIKKIGQLGVFKGGGTPSRDVQTYWNGTIPWISSSDLIDNNIHYINCTRYISNQAVKESATSIIPSKSIIIVSRVGVGKVAVCEYDVCTSQDFTNLIPEKDNSIFLAYLIQLQTINFAKFNQGTSIKGFVKNDLESIKINMPCLKEQKKVADFLTAVDKKIQQLTRKKELLEQYKKGVMQKIFDQEIRFKDKNGKPFPDWKEKRLGAIAEILKGKDISKNDIVVNGKTPCILYGELYTKYDEVIEDVLSFTDLEIEALFFSKLNDVIIPSSGETHIDLATASCIQKDGVALGGDINVIRSDIDGIFLSYYLNNKRKHAIASLAQGSSVIHLYGSHLASLKLDLPHSEEQKLIGCFLKCLDVKKELIESKLTLYQEFKKGLLQQMFV